MQSPGAAFRSSSSFACCSGVSLFLMRTSSVTWARLISRSIVKTFSSCASACCSSTRGCLTMATIFSISSCSFHCHSVNLNCICLISVLKKIFCSSLSPIASWCCITSSGAKKLLPNGSSPGFCPRAAPTARKTSAQTQRTLALISFLLRVDGNLHVRLAESRCCLQDLLARYLQEHIAWRSPFRQPLGRGEFGLQHRWRCSPVQQQSHHQRRRNHRSRAHQHPPSHRPGALLFAFRLRGGHHARAKLPRPLRPSRHQRQHRIHPFTAHLHHLELRHARGARLHVLLETARRRSCHVPCRISRQPPPVSPLPVERQSERDSVHPGSELLRLAQRRKLLVRAQKSFLRHLFRVGRVSQHSVGNLENAPLVFRYARAKRCPVLLRFHSGNQGFHARACHAAPAATHPDTAHRSPVQGNTTLRSANSSSQGLLSPARSGWGSGRLHGPLPISGDAGESEQVELLKRRQNSLQHRRQPHCLQPLPLLRV